jgi:hypothetical protein
MTPPCDLCKPITWSLLLDEQSKLLTRFQFKELNGLLDIIVFEWSDVTADATPLA